MQLFLKKVGEKLCESEKYHYLCTAFVATCAWAAHNVIY